MSEAGLLERTLSRFLDAGRKRIGQIVIESDNGLFILQHRDDANRADLTTRTDPNEAAEIAKYDDAGIYRPLKTAPNLRHGWCLELAGLTSLRRALDLFYPARIAALLAFEEKRLPVTPLRETLGRQSGMYRVTNRITDAQADQLVCDVCRSDGGCLRTILWPRDDSGAAASAQLPPEKFDPAYDQTGGGEKVLPLLCQEACNLLVAAARKVVKP